MTKASHARPAREKSAIAISSPLSLPADAIAAARDICERYRDGQDRGIPAVAARIGMQAGVLYNKLSGSEDLHHKLSVRDMLLIWLVTKEIGHLQALARAMNCACFPLGEYSALSDAALLELACKAHEEGGQFHKVVRTALEDGRIDAVELVAIKREAFEWVGAILALYLRLEALASA